MTPTQDTRDLFWRRRAERSLENARRFLADAGITFADEGEITTAYYLRYEDVGPTTPVRRRIHGR